MKQLLSDFFNILYPKPGNAAWKWSELFWALFSLSFIIGLLILSKL